MSSRDSTNTQLRAALDSATQQWGVKVMRIELKNINPPEEIRLTMEKQMTAERTRRAVVTTAEGEKSSAILRAEGQKQAQIVNAEGAKQAAILAAEGQAEARLRVAQAEAQAIQVVAQAIGGGGQSGAVPDRAAVSRIAQRHRGTARRSSCSCRTKPAASWRRSAESASCSRPSRQSSRRDQPIGGGVVREEGLDVRFFQGS